MDGYLPAFNAISCVVDISPLCSKLLHWEAFLVIVIAREQRNVVSEIRYALEWSTDFEQNGWKLQDRSSAVSLCFKRVASCDRLKVYNYGRAV